VRDGVSTLNEKLKQKTQDSTFIYEQERKEHLDNLGKSIQELKEAQDKLNNDPTTLKDSTGALKSPKERRQELEEIKQRLSSYNETKQKQMFIGKRERLIKGGWRHGIVGVENAGLIGDEQQSVFFQDQTRQKQMEQESKDAINKRRQKSNTNLPNNSYRTCARNANF
jgi:hypothetical protein